MGILKNLTFSLPQRLIFFIVFIYTRFFIYKKLIEICSLQGWTQRLIIRGCSATATNFARAMHGFGYFYGSIFVKSPKQPAAGDFFEKWSFCATVILGNFWAIVVNFLPCPRKTGGVAPLPPVDPPLCRAGSSGKL